MAEDPITAYARSIADKALGDYGGGLVLNDDGDAVTFKISGDSPSPANMRFINSMMQAQRIASSQDPDFPGTVYTDSFAEVSMPKSTLAALQANTKANFTDILDRVRQSQDVARDVLTTLPVDTLPKNMTADLLGKGSQISSAPGPDGRIMTTIYLGGAYDPDIASKAQTVVDILNRKALPHADLNDVTFQLMSDPEHKINGIITIAQDDLLKLKQKPGTVDAMKTDIALELSNPDTKPAPVIAAVEPAKLPGTPAVKVIVPAEATKTPTVATAADVGDHGFHVASLPPLPDKTSTKSVTRTATDPVASNTPAHAEVASLAPVATEDAAPKGLGEIPHFNKEKGTRRQRQQFFKDNEAKLAQSPELAALDAELKANHKGKHPYHSFLKDGKLTSVAQLQVDLEGAGYKPGGVDNRAGEGTWKATDSALKDLHKPTTKVADLKI